MPLLINKSKPTPKPSKAASVAEFDVRPGTFAVIHSLVEGTGAARLLHGLLELWVSTTPIMRPHDGQQLPFLFLTAHNLQKLTGLPDSKLERAFAELRTCPFIYVKRGRLSPKDGINRRMIHLDAKALWLEVDAVVGATTKTLVDKGNGTKVYEYPVDTKILPPLFFALYKQVKGPT